MSDPTIIPGRLSPDIEDRRDQPPNAKAVLDNSFMGYLHNQAVDMRSLWEGIKQEPWFHPKPPPPVDKSFYDPTRDAASQTPRR